MTRLPGSAEELAAIERDLELAGGVEGGMPAGSAGGPGQSDADDDPENRAGEPRR